jgi:hypothetical protein
MTFQNLLSRIPKWNNNIIEDEKNRMIERSKCDYLEDLISCVHIIQLKILTCIRVGNKQKKIDITIPKLDTFIHKIYIHTARKIYTNVYLFEKNISPLQLQKNNRELELIIQECILMAVRESIPTESIIRAYMDEGIEQEEEVFIEDIEEDQPPQSDTNKNDNDNDNKISDQDNIPDVVPSIHNIDDTPFVSKLAFNDIDSVMDEENIEYQIEAPKTIERLEDISSMRAMQRKLYEISNDDDDDYNTIKLTDDNIDLTGFDILDKPDTSTIDDSIILNDVEELF